MDFSSFDFSRSKVDSSLSSTQSLFWGGGLLRKDPGFLEYLTQGSFQYQKINMFFKEISHFIPHSYSGSLLGIPENS